MSEEKDQPRANPEIPSEVAGLRMTKQRREVYGLLIDDTSHPTATDVFRKVQERMPQISLATVYNCLEALVQHGLVNQVNFDREPSRFCANLKDHAHFHDENSGSILDINFKNGVNIADILDLPPGTRVSDLEITIRGELPAGG